MIVYLDQDPKFYYGSYPESGTTGYNGEGWYIWDNVGVIGPFDNEQQAKDKQEELNDG